MNPNQYLFDAISNMTGGIITDIESLFLGGIVLAFICVGLDYLKDAFNHMLDARSHDRFLEDAKDMQMERDQYRRGSSEWEEANYMYRHFIGKAANSRLRRWGK